MASNGTRKYSRNQQWCVAYKARGQREKNKKKNLKRHLKGQPGDLIALKALQAL